MSNQKELYKHERFLLMSLDPIHVGTGGYRLGRVDLSIVREPGTQIPKLPGTSLSGAIRQYAAYRYGSIRCAGHGQGDEKENKGHCRDKECPICYTFGYMKGSDSGHSGTVNIGDARILLFPVHSLAGPVWVTCSDILSEFKIESVISHNKVKCSSGLMGHQNLNLGWLMLPVEEGDFELPQGIHDTIKTRTVLVSSKLFSQIVNSNLEVRTSVSIDPKTGAASDKALFTYEAIPRAALLWFDVVQDNYREHNNGDGFPETDKTCKGEDLTEKWKEPLDVVNSGLKLAEHLGIGGMGTRGFGRIKLLNREVVSS